MGNKDGDVYMWSGWRRGQGKGEGSLIGGGLPLSRPPPPLTGGAPLPPSSSLLLELSLYAAAPAGRRACRPHLRRRAALLELAPREEEPSWLLASRDEFSSLTEAGRCARSADSWRTDGVHGDCGFHESSPSDGVPGPGATLSGRGHAARPPTEREPLPMLASR